MTAMRSRLQYELRTGSYGAALVADIGKHARWSLRIATDETDVSEVEDGAFGIEIHRTQRRIERWW